MLLYVGAICRTVLGSYSCCAWPCLSIYLSHTVAAAYELSSVQQQLSSVQQ